MQEEGDKGVGREKDERREEKTVTDKGASFKKDQQVEFDWPRERVCHTHERAIPIQETVEALDITEEGQKKTYDKKGKDFESDLMSQAVFLF